MSLNRKTAWLTAWILFAGIVPAFGQHSPPLQDMQLFGPAEISEYGGGQRPNEGFFFAFDGINWSISAPDVTPIGFPSTRVAYRGWDINSQIVQHNSLDTSDFDAGFTPGTRFELGWIDDHCGFKFGMYDLKDQRQRFEAASVDMVFSDPDPDNVLAGRLLEGYYILPNDGGTPPISTFPADIAPGDREHLDQNQGIVDAGGNPVDAVLRDLPLSFDDVFVRNTVDTWGAELMYTYRLHPQRHGGIVELYFGVRYIEFDDTFSVEANGTRFDDDNDPATPSIITGALADSFWQTEVENHIVGPQVGVKWFRQAGRWSASAEGRFLAGFNRQNYNQVGILGSELTPLGTEGMPYLMGPTAFDHGAHVNEWSPIGEARVHVDYTFTRAISAGFGWSAIWMEGIARGSTSVLYEVPGMGLILSNNDQDVLMHGYDLRFSINY